MKYTIKQKRDECDISQEDLSAKSGVSRTIISNLELGSDYNPTIDTLERIASVFNCDVKDLFYSSK